MPRRSKYPRLRVHVRKGAGGRVRTYYFYDMRHEGKPDVALGTEWSEALEKWAELHEHRPRAKGRLQEAIDRFRLETLPTYTNADTLRKYTAHLVRVEAALGGMTWDEITLPLLREYLDQRESMSKADAKAKTARRAGTQGNREMSVLSIVWGKARLWGMTRLPWPAAGVKDWKNPEAARSFEVTDALFDAVYKVADQLLRDAMDISSATGMRLTDVRTVRLPVGDVLRLKASKTGKEADFDLSVSQVLPALIRRRRAISASHVMLLSTPDGFPVTVSMLRGAYDRARESAAANHPDLAPQLRKMYLRDMRKRASDLAEDVEAAAGLLQHSSTAVTKKHYRSAVTKLRPVR